MGDSVITPSQARGGVRFMVRLPIMWLAVPGDVGCGGNVGVMPLLPLPPPPASPLPSTHRCTIALNAPGCRLTYDAGSQTQAAEVGGMTLEVVREWAHSAAGCGYGYYTLWTRRASAGGGRYRSPSDRPGSCGRAVPARSRRDLRPKLVSTTRGASSKPTSAASPWTAQCHGRRVPPVRSTTISMVSVERLPGEINPNQD